MFLKLLCNEILIRRSPAKNVFTLKKGPVTWTFLPYIKYYELYGEDADIMDFQTSSVMKSVNFGNIYLMDQDSSVCPSSL